MFRRFRKEKTHPLDAPIAVVLGTMDNSDVLSEEYSTLIRHLERFHDIKEKEQPDPVSRDTIALVAGNLLGILLIVAYEQKHVMTSKGFSQIIRPRSN